MINGTHSLPWGTEVVASAMQLCAVYLPAGHTHKERHFVLVLFLPDLRMRHDENGLRAADRRRCRRQFGLWRVSCILQYNTRCLSFRSYFDSAASFAMKWLELVPTYYKNCVLYRLKIWLKNLTVASNWTF